jgi:hypothetical protein
MVKELEDFCPICGANEYWGIEWSNKHKEYLKRCLKCQGDFGLVQRGYHENKKAKKGSKKA